MPLAALRACVAGLREDLRQVEVRFVDEQGRDVISP